MKKLIILCALVVTAIIAYVIGYCFFSFDSPKLNLNERDYIMPEIPETKTNEVEAFNEETKYLLYPFYGEIIIYRSDGSFYDYTGIFLSDLNKDDQIEILRRDKVFTIRELYEYLEIITLR